MYNRIDGFEHDLMLAELEFHRGSPVSQILLAPPQQSLSTGHSLCGRQTRFRIFPSPNPLHVTTYSFGLVNRVLGRIECIAERTYHEGFSVPSVLPINCHRSLR